MRKIVIALPKGKRLLGKAYDIFKKAGYTSTELEREIEFKEKKKLEFESNCGRIVFILTRIADIPQYVDKNWADMGICAFDNYREYELSSTNTNYSMRGDNFISNILPDLHLCEKSRFCVAGRAESLDFYQQCKISDEKVLTVGTSYPAIASKYFEKNKMLADIIYVSGSTEVMPKFGEVDCIFDIVESGKALEENGLIIYDEAMQIKTKVLVSKAALKYDENIRKTIDNLQLAIDN